MIWALSLVLALHPLEKVGMDHLYNLDFAGAAEKFRALSEAVPSSPAGPHYLATLILMEELTRRGALAGETFLSGRYWTGLGPEPVGKEVDERFQAYLEESSRRAQGLLAGRAAERDALYFLGADESIRSAYEATLKRSYFAAYRAGRRARNWHQRLREIDPGNGDACLVLGIYEYTLATLPRSLKVFAFLIGARGSKERGRELVERAAREGTRAYWDARLVLTVLDQREKRYRLALSRLRELEVAFPRNPLFPLERGWVHLLRKDGGAARRMFEQILARRELEVPHFEKVEPALLLLRLGESFLLEGKPEAALERLTAALQASGSGPRLKPLLHLRRGQAYDLLGRREDALGDYEAALQLESDRSSRRAAERYRKTPFHQGR